MVEPLFLADPQGCLQFVIVVFPDHTNLLFLKFNVFETFFQKNHQCVKRFGSRSGPFLVGQNCLHMVLVDSTSRHRDKRCTQLHTVCLFFSH